MPPSRVMPPPPAIGSARPRPSTSSGDGETPRADEGADAPAPETSPSEAAADGDESATSRWRIVDAPIAEDDGPSDEAASRPRPSSSASPVAPPSSSPGGPIVPPPPRIEGAGGASVPMPPPIDAQSSNSGLRVPSIDASSSHSGLRRSSLGDDGWDLDDDGSEAGTDAPVPAKPAVGAALPPTPRTPPPGVGAVRPRPLLPSPPGVATAPTEAKASSDAGEPEPGGPEALASDGLPAEPEATTDPPEEPTPSVPRLPVPGMLRDGSVPPRPADFRAAPRLRPQTAAAMTPLPGVVPPRLRPLEGDDAPKLATHDTMQLVAEVATELMQAQEEDEASAAAAAVPPAEAAVEVKADGSPRASAVTPFPAATSAAPLAFMEVPVAAAPGAEAAAKRRGMLMGMGVMGTAAALALVAWLVLGGDDEPTDPQVAAAPAATAEVPQPPAHAAPTVADEPTPPEPTPAASTGPHEALADSGDTTGVAEAADTSAATADTGETGDPEALGAEGDDASEPEVVAMADGDKPSRRSAGGKPKPRAKADPQPAKEEPKAATKTEESLSAEELLKRARSAYASGKGSSAYSMASKSNRMRPSGDAAEVMALSACAMNDANKAKNALKNVPLLRRGGVRNTCKSKHGVKLGL